MVFEFLFSGTGPLVVIGSKASITELVFFEFPSFPFLILLLMTWTRQLPGRLCAIDLRMYRP